MFRRVCLVLMLFSAAAAFRGAEPAEKIAIKAARLFDGRSEALVSGAVVIVSGSRIEAVGRDLAIPSGARVIDLGDATLLPGFIDAHVHLSQEASENWFRDFFEGETRFPAEQAHYAALYAQRTLEAGFTTVRNVGADDYVDVGLRNAINAGIVPGPRMLVAVHAIGSTGGHGDGLPIPPDRQEAERPTRRSLQRRRASAARRCAIRSSTAPTSSSACRREAYSRFPIRSRRPR